MQEANKLEFPMARFMFKDIEFPDDKHYRNVMQKLKQDYDDHLASEGVINTVQGRNDIYSQDALSSDHGIFNIQGKSERSRENAAK